MIDLSKEHGLGARSCLMALAIVWCTGCSLDPIEVGDLDPQVVAIGPVYGDGNVITVHWAGYDAEGDVVDLLARYCVDERCLPLSELEPGGDGLVAIPLVEDEITPHVFLWRYPCETETTVAPSTSVTLELSIIGSSEPALTFGPFTPVDVGATGLECGRAGDDDE